MDSIPEAAVDHGTVHAYKEEGMLQVQSDTVPEQVQRRIESSGVWGTFQCKPAEGEQCVLGTVAWDNHELPLRLECVDGTVIIWSLEGTHEIHRMGDLVRKYTDDVRPPS